MDLASLRAQQIELASSVCREDRLDKDPPAFIGGADVGFEQGGEVTRAAMVLLKYPSLELVEYKVARIATTMPYIPGFLSFREYPALLAAWEQLSQKPDLLFVDGLPYPYDRRRDDNRRHSRRNRHSPFLRRVVCQPAPSRHPVSRVAHLTSGLMTPSLWQPR